MRTTLTLEPDVAALVRHQMSERGLSLKQAVNQAIRAGLAPVEGGPTLRTATYAMGPPRASLDRALALAGELEDEELIRKLAAGR